MRIAMIRASAMVCARQSQSMVMMLPFYGALAISPVPRTVVSPTRFAWCFLSGKSPLQKDAHASGLRHAMRKCST